MSSPSERIGPHLDPGHGHEGGHETAHGTLRGYLTGFALAAILTAIPFWLVMDHVLASASTTILIVLALGAAQIVVHVIYFLHLNTRSENGWNMLAFIFTVVLVVIVLGASIWVMYNENANMMPTASQSGQQRNS